MIRTLAIVGLLCAGPAQAFSPAAECLPEGAERQAGVHEYDVHWHGGGFVFYVTWHEGAGLFLDDCKGQRRLVMRSAEGDGPYATYEAQRALMDVVLASLESKQRYTMGQISAVAREAGAKTKMGKADYVSCGCDLYGNKE